MLLAFPIWGRAAPSAASWQGICYEGFAEHVEQLAGADAVDCGVHRHGDARNARRIWRCVEGAYRKRVAYKLAVIDTGASMPSCRAAVGPALGLPVFFEYFRNRAFGRPGWGEVRVQRCHDITRREGPAAASVFGTDDCVDAEDLLRQLFRDRPQDMGRDGWANVRALPH